MYLSRARSGTGWCSALVSASLRAHPIARISRALRTRISMRNFHDEQGREWIATAREEATPRHHGRWYLAFHSAGDASQLMPLPEIRWQTADSAARTLRTM